MSGIVLNEIYIYPIKSLTGLSVSSWPVIKTGLKYDRQWMLIDNQQQFLSQRSLPKMALIKTELTERQLIVSAPQMTKLHLDLEPELGRLIDCTIWHDQVDAAEVSVEANRWFSQFLETECRLVYLPDTARRPVNPNFANPHDLTALSDGFPFLLISENSLNSLNDAMQLNLPMSRFRPNLVISGCAAYAEDTWREITIGAIGFRLPKPCSRCSVPTIDQETGKTSKEPLTTLNRLRKWDNKVYFGQNALHNALGVLTVGDNVYLNTTSAANPPIK